VEPLTQRIRVEPLEHRSGHHERVSVLAVKVLLAPSFVVGASLVARRFGARIGGLVGGLPVVAAPILLVFALSHGRAFAAQAAAGTLLGLISLMTFIVVYARLVRHTSSLVSLVAGWSAFFAMTGLLSLVTVSAAAALTVVLPAILVSLAATPRCAGAGSTAVSPTPWDLPLRALSALALVLALTALAGQLGANLSGLLAPFPVIASVLAVFTYAQHGHDDLLRIMRGFLVGLVAYALFCFTLAVTLKRLGIAESFALAAAVALATQAIAIALTLRAGGPLRRLDATTHPEALDAA
jgi:hypothetical protein